MVEKFTIHSVCVKVEEYINFSFLNRHVTPEQLCGTIMYIHHRPIHDMHPHAPPSYDHYPPICSACDYIYMSDRSRSSCSQSGN